MFTVPNDDPIVEVNHCHGTGTKGHPCDEGGGGAKGVTAAQIIPPGQSFDLVAAAAACGFSNCKTPQRRFLLNPFSQEVALGVAYGSGDPELSHAEALAAAEGRDVQRGAAWETAQARRYDQYRVHGHLKYDATRDPSSAMAIVIDRVVTSDTTFGEKVRPEVEKLDLLYKAAARFVALGATKDTRVLSRDLDASGWTTLGKVFPSLFSHTKPR